MDVKIKEHDVLKLSYTVTGTPKPTVQIIKDNEEKLDLLINHDGRSLDIVIENSMRTDSGLYKVLIMNEVGQAEAVCNVLVYGEFHYDFFWRGS